MREQVCLHRALFLWQLDGWAGCSFQRHADFVQILDSRTERIESSFENPYFLAARILFLLAPLRSFLQGRQLAFS